MGSSYVDRDEANFDSMGVCLDRHAVFERYKKFFKSDIAMIIASAVVFAYAHVLYINWVAPFLSFIAGLIFATTYSKTKSLALVTIEHGLYGNVLFLIGLGWYFYGGAVVQP